MTATRRPDEGDATDPQGPRPSPTSSLPAAARPFQGRRAGVVSRVTANAVDLGIVVLTLGALYAGYAGLLFLWNPSGFQFPSVPFGVTFLLGSALLTGYLAIAWATTGRTYGDHLLGLRVLGPRGHRMRAALALIRAVFCVFFPLGLLWCAVNRKNRSIQDILLRTSVVYDWTETRIS